MSIYTTSVQETINRGNRIITLSSLTILISTVALFILLLIFNLSFWDIAILPLGILFFILYTNWVTSKWQQWAYDNVEDIHQFQRSAEIAGLLSRQYVESSEDFMNDSQKATLMQLNNRFSEPVVFIDDDTIPGETIIYGKPSFGYPEKHTIILNEQGIKVNNEALIGWAHIYNEHVGLVSRKWQSRKTGAYVSGGSKNFFKFDCPQGHFETPLASLKISDWKLDLLLYIYRGRYNIKHQI